MEKKKKDFWTFTKAYSDFPFLFSGLPSIEIRATLLLIEANENDTCHFYMMFEAFFRFSNKMISRILPDRNSFYF
jgi:hypothetical protein